MPCPTTLAEQPQTCPVPESSPEEEELSFEEQSLCVIYEERREDKKVKKNNERIGNEIDRIYKDRWKNRKLKIIYQEWQFGLIT